MASSKATCALQENTRIYYVPKGQVEQVVDALVLRSVVDLTGTIYPSGTASSGDYVVVWLPDCVGFCGFLQVPTGRQTVTAGESVSFKVVKVRQSLDTGVTQLMLRTPVLHFAICLQSFKAVKSKAIVELRGLAFNPSTFTTGFGKLVADMNDCKRGAKYPYDPESVMTALTDLWCKADAGKGFAR